MAYTKGEWKAIKTEMGEYVIVPIQARVLGKENAQLIASAPDMYEALKRIFERADRGLPLDRTVHLIPAGKALAKAESK